MGLRIWSDLLSPPRRDFVLDTMLPLEAAVARLSGAVEPAEGSNIWLPRPRRSFTCPFWGTVSRDGFTIYRTLRYKNSLQPQISGRFYAAATGTRIPVVMRTAGLVIPVVVGAFGLGMLAAILARRAAGPAAPLPLVARLTPWGLPLLGYLTCSVGFGLEACWARDMLTRLFEALPSAAPAD